LIPTLLSDKPGVDGVTLRKLLRGELRGRR